MTEWNWILVDSEFIGIVLSVVVILVLAVIPANDPSRLS